ncbi:MAG: excisionase family DNA-binding protein [Thermomicrobiales bacterium]
MHEAARIKGVSYHTVSRAVRTQKLRATRLGRLVLIKRDDLDAWEPMRARATKRYPQRVPMPQETPGVIELASGERLELARRVSAVYGAIQQSALFDEPDRFTQTIAERFASAMEFDRVALWLLDAKREYIELTTPLGEWFRPDEVPTEPVRLPYDPEKMYLSPPAVYPGLSCWMSDPKPIHLNDAFSTSLTSNGQLLGYVIGDHDGRPFSLTEHQIALGHDLATLIGMTLELRRSRDLEAIARRQAETEISESTAALARLTRAINQQQDLDQILRQAGRDAVRLAGSVEGGVAIQADEESTVYFWTRNGEDLPTANIPLRLPILPGTLRAFKAGKPVLHTWADASELEQTYWNQSGSRSSLILPINVDGDLAGAMMINFPYERPVITAEQIDICEALAAGCVAALRQEQLLGRLASKRRQIQKFSDPLSATGS